MKNLLSYLYPVIIEKTSGPFNPVLEVTIENGKYVLNAAHANYSFGSLHFIFNKAFQTIKIGERGLKNVLLLGLGGGSVPVLLFEEFKMNCHITAIEIDEKVIELAKKYFNIQRFQHLEIICEDAFDYVRHCNKKFDLIISDIFIDNKVPEKIESKEFLLTIKKLMQKDSIFLFNKIPGIENGIESFNLLQKNVTTIFGEFEIIAVGENKVLVIKK
jgi:spermidine synthase